MSRSSSHDFLVLHGVRIMGFADAPGIARRFHLDAESTAASLRHAEVQGWVSHTAFGDTAGWSLTGSGRAENERGLATELTRAGAADDVRAVHRDFLPLNRLVLQAVTDWQLKPTAGDRLGPNDHEDPVWDAGVLRELAAVDRALGPLVARLVRQLPRFAGYDERFSTALARASAGDTGWIDRTDVDSCHRVWFELHEDLIATLGIDRATSS